MSDDKQSDKQETPQTNAMADRFGDIDPDSPYWEALELATKLERDLTEVEDAITNWYVAAAPYATPEALKEALSARVPSSVGPAPR